MADRDTTLKATIELDVDKSSKTNIEKGVKNLNLDKLFKDDVAKGLNEAIGKFKIKQAELSSLQKQFDELRKIGSKSKEAKDLQAEIQKRQKELSKSQKGSYDSQQAFKENVQKKIIEAVKKVADYVRQQFQELYASAKQLMEDVSDYITDSKYKVMSSSAREQMLTYGLSESENYAFSKVKSEMGISSEEDLFWMTKEQQEYFAERIGYWTEQYGKTKELAKMFQEYETEMANLKQDLTVNFIQFFLENRDLIKSVMTMSLEFMKFIITVLGGIANILGYAEERSDTQRSSAASDIISSYTTSSSKSVTQNNTYNGVSSSTQAQISQQQQANLQQMLLAFNE